LSFRHANASTGSDQLNSKEPNWWKSCDSKLARQITTPIGYEQSEKTGWVMKKLKLPFDTLMTSEFCRCRQTAESFKLNLPIKEEKALTYYVYEETKRYANTINLYENKAVSIKNHIGITHAGFAAGPPDPALLGSLQWGDCAVFKQNQQGKALSHIGNIPLTEWLRLYDILK
jgi:phosphohistidine phosphatase SixA